MLFTLGFNVIACASALDGLKLIEQSLLECDPFQLILLDQQMPCVNGLEFAQLMANRAEMFIPVILLSSSLNRDEVHEAERLGWRVPCRSPLNGNFIVCDTEVMGHRNQVAESSSTEIQLL